MKGKERKGKGGGGEGRGKREEGRGKREEGRASSAFLYPIFYPCIHNICMYT